jgi:hypothetical protein
MGETWVCEGLILKRWVWGVIIGESAARPLRLVLQSIRTYYYGCFSCKSMCGCYFTDVNGACMLNSWVMTWVMKNDGRS